MGNKEVQIKELLAKQMELLYKQSGEGPKEYTAQNACAMVEIAKCLLDLETNGF